MLFSDDDASSQDAVSTLTTNQAREPVNQMRQPANQARGEAGRLASVLIPASQLSRQSAAASTATQLGLAGEGSGARPVREGPGVIQRQTSGPFDPSTGAGASRAQLAPFAFGVSYF